MSYSVNLIHPISTLSLDFSIKPSQYDDHFINIFSENLPYHLKHTSWNNQDTTFYFSDIPNNQYSGYFKNPELFLKDYSSLKNNGVSFSGITEHSNFKSMLPFLKKIQPDLLIHQYFVLSLIS